MTRRRLIVLAVVAWIAFAVVWGTDSARASDEQRPGGTTGAGYVSNKYVWTGDASRYGQLAVEYHIDVLPGAVVYARWECSSKNGPTDNLSGGASGLQLDVTPGSINGSQIVLSDQDRYCAYHVWATTGGFRITTATVHFWNQEFVGGGGTNPSPAPGSTSGPGSSVSGPSASPSPTPAPPSPDPDIIVNDSPWVIARSGNAYSTFVLARAFDTNDGTDYHSASIGANRGADIRFDYVVGVGAKCRVTGYRVLAAADTSASWSIEYSDNGTSWTVYDSGATGGAAEDFGLAPLQHEYWRLRAGDTIGGAPLAGWSVYTWSLYGWCTDDAEPSPSPSASPSPTPAPSASPGSCEPGFVWSGTDCEAVPPPPPWYPSPPPPLPTPSRGPNLGGNGGLEEPAPPDTNGNGLAACEADDGTYSKPGQAPLQALHDTSFPGSINPLDYIPPIMNMVSNVPIVISNAGQTMVNTGVDFVIPGPCVLTIIEDRMTEIQAEPPFVYFAELETALSGGAGSASLAAIPLPGGNSIAFPMDTLTEAGTIVRPILLAVVVLIGLLTILSAILGTFGVKSAD